MREGLRVLKNVDRFVHIQGVQDVPGAIDLDPGVLDVGAGVESEPEPVQGGRGEVFVQEPSQPGISPPRPDSLGALKAAKKSAKLNSIAAMSHLPQRSKRP